MGSHLLQLPLKVEEDDLGEAADWLIAINSGKVRCSAIYWDNYDEAFDLTMKNHEKPWTTMNNHEKTNH